MVLGISPLFSVLRNSIEIIGYYVVFLLLDKSRFSWKKTISICAGWILLLIAHGTLWILYHPQSYSRWCAAALMVESVVFFVFMSEYGVFQILYNASLITTAMLIQIYICVRFAQLFFHNSLWADVTMRLLMVGLGIWLCHHYLRGFYRKVVEDMRFDWKRLSFVSIVGNSLFIYFGMMPTHVMVRPVREQFVGISIGGLLLLTHLLMLRVLFFMQREMEAKRELGLSLQGNRMLKKELSLMQEFVRETRRTRHDMRHHNLILYEFAKKGKTDEIRNYLEVYEEEMERERPDWYCSNPAVDSILSAYDRKACQNGVEMHTDASVEREIGIGDLDFTAILGNLLENAIHGAISSGRKNPKINVQIGRKSAKLGIMVSNTSAEDIHFENGLPKSQNGENVGIDSIMRSVDKYDGEVDFQLREGMFICRVLLKLPGRAMQGCSS